MKTLNYNIISGIFTNSFAELQSFHFFASEFVRNTSSYTTKRTIRLPRVSFNRNSFSWKRFIISLFFPSSPTTILQTIMKITVNPVNSSILFSKQFTMNFIRFVHILLKFLKRLPKVFYSLTSVILKRFVVFVRTSTNNLSVNVIKPIAVHPVLSSSFFHSINPSTAARSSMSILKIISPRRYISSTITRTQKDTSPLFSSNKFLNKQSIKFLTNQVLKFTHKPILSKWLGLVNVKGGDSGAVTSKVLLDKDKNKK